MLLDAEKVRATRLERGWTQEHLAGLCDVSVRTIQRTEKTGVASLETSNALAAVLETDRQALLMQGGAHQARTDLPLLRVAVIAAGTFALGLGLGVLL